MNVDTTLKFSFPEKSGHPATIVVFFITTTKNKYTTGVHSETSDQTVIG